MKTIQTFSIDLPYKTPDVDSIKLMDLLSELLEVEINYTIERKTANNKPHVHAYCTIHPKKLEDTLKDYFGGLSHKIQPCYDLKGWKEYITKDCELRIAQPIKPIKPIEPLKPLKPLKSVDNTKSIVNGYSKMLKNYALTFGLKYTEC
jgi:hypothetical protein